MGIKLSHAKQISRLRLDGVVDISVAAELKVALLKAVAVKKNIRVSAEAVSELDLTAYQLLWAAARQAKNKGMSFALAGRMPLPAETALADLGLPADALIA